MAREPNGKICVNCGAPLLGQQERFCSRECKRKWWAVEYRGTEVRRCINCGNVLWSAKEGKRKDRKTSKRYSIPRHDGGDSRDHEGQSQLWATGQGGAQCLI